VWRAGHRGMKELDLVLGAFARARVPGMDGDALAHFESLLAEADTDLFDWVMGTCAGAGAIRRSGHRCAETVPVLT
jgi:antitoxin CptB